MCLSVPLFFSLVKGLTKHTHKQKILQKISNMHDMNHLRVLLIRVSKSVISLNCISNGHLWSVRFNVSYITSCCCCIMLLSIMTLLIYFPFDYLNPDFLTTPCFCFFLSFFILVFNSSSPSFQHMHSLTDLIELIFTSHGFWHLINSCYINNTLIMLHRFWNVSPFICLGRLASHDYK